MAWSLSSAEVAHLGFVNEGTHVANNPGSLLLGVTRPVSEASVNNRHDERQAGCINSVYEHCLQEGVQCRLGMLVGSCNGQQQGLHQALHLRVSDHTSNLQSHHV